MCESVTRIKISATAGGQSNHLVVSDQDHRPVDVDVCVCVCETLMAYQSELHRVHKFYSSQTFLPVHKRFIYLSCFDLPTEATFWVDFNKRDTDRFRLS